MKCPHCATDQHPALSGPEDHPLGYRIAYVVCRECDTMLSATVDFPKESPPSVIPGQLRLAA